MIHKVGVPEGENEVEGGEVILTLSTEAKDFPEPKKNLNLGIEGLRFRFLNSKGEGKMTFKKRQKNLEEEKAIYKIRRIRLVAHVSEKQNTESTVFRVPKVVGL